MKIKIVSGQTGFAHHVAIVLVFAALVGIVGTYFLARGHAVTPLYYLCDNSGSGPCIADQGNVKSADNPIVMRARGSTGMADDFQLNYVGKVSGTNAWPFISGKGLNTKFNGDFIYQIQYAPNNSASGWCAASPDQAGQYVWLERCSNTTWWVEAYNGYYWVSVRATNLLNDNSIMVMYSGGQTSGTHVRVKSYQAGNGWEEFGAVRQN